MNDLLEGFELYEKQRVSPGAPPFITVQARGVFSLNPSAYKALGEPQFVELLYSTEKSAIAIRTVTTETLTSYQVRSTNHGGAFNIAGKAFMTYHQITIPVSRRYTPQYAADGIIIMSMNDPFVELHPTRGQSDSLATKAPPNVGEVDSE